MAETTIKISELAELTEFDGSEKLFVERNNVSLKLDLDTIRQSITPTDTQVENAVDDWLTDHPEATTTVQDGSITYAKLASDAKGKYDSIGDLTQLNTTDKTSLVGAINEVKASDILLAKTFEGNQSFYGLGNFQHYGLNTDGSFTINQKYRVSNNDPMVFDRDITISVSNGFKWGYIPFTNGTAGTWSGWKTTDFKISAETSFVVQIARTTEITSEIADVYEFLSAVTFASVSSVNSTRLNEAEISMTDLKSYLGFEIGGLDGAGKDYNPQTWRLRTKIAILPFDIVIEKSDGYQFKVLTFDDASLSNPVDSGWITNDGATFSVAKNTYFKILALCTTQDSSTYAITVIATSNVYNNIFVYRNDNKLRDIVLKVSAIKSFNPCFVSMAHQGFSATGQYYGNNKISSYIGAFEHGFDTAETDIQWSSDGVPVCCHDATFTDSDDGTTVITIANHTVEELKTYGYYGETIATLDEVMATCKTYGLRLELDKVQPTWTDEQWQAVFDIVSKYQMQKHVIWTLPYNTNATLNKILAYDKWATVLLNLQDASLLDSYVTWVRSVLTDNCTIILGVLYTVLSVSDLISYNKELTERNFKILVWTIDDLATYESYMPYCWGIASNKLCAKDVMF